MKIECDPSENIGVAKLQFLWNFILNLYQEQHQSGTDLETFIYFHIKLRILKIFCPQCPGLGLIFPELSSSSHC